MNESKLRFFARVMNKDGKVISDEIKHDLGILISYNDITFIINEDNTGNLKLISLDKSLVILPESSNSVRIA